MFDVIALYKVTSLKIIIKYELDFYLTFMINIKLTAVTGKKQSPIDLYVDYCVMFFLLFFFLHEARTR